MIKLNILLVLATLAYLSADFMDNEKLEKADANIQNNEALVRPVLISKELLPVEEKWLALKAEKNAEQQSSINKPLNNKTNNVFLIGEQAYVLYGIFNSAQQPFVLLKDPLGTFIKLPKGEELENNFVLTSIKNNMITFSNAEQVIEFKLFERSN